MTPGNYPLTIYKGDTYKWQFVLWMDAAKTQPADLTDVVAKAEIRVSSGGGAILGTLTCTVTLPNIIDVVLPADVSAGLNNTKGQWDLQLTYPNLDVATVVAGAVTVTPDVTDSSAVTAMATSARVAVLK